MEGSSGSPGPNEGMCISHYQAPAYPDSLTDIQTHFTKRESWRFGVITLSLAAWGFQSTLHLSLSVGISRQIENEASVLLVEAAAQPQYQLSTTCSYLLTRYPNHAGNRCRVEYRSNAPSWQHLSTSLVHELHECGAARRACHVLKCFHGTGSGQTPARLSAASPQSASSTPSSPSGFETDLTGWKFAAPSGREMKYRD